MSLGNRTRVISFILLGFSVDSNAQAALFGIFVIVYAITLLGNLLIITLVMITPKLHTPMYFFLFNLSFLDIGSASVTVPRMLRDLLIEQKYIAFNECITQVFAFLFLAGTEVFLLSAMCFDRLLAISRPLKYPILMSRSVSFIFGSSCWMTGFFYALTTTLQVSQLNYCGDVIDNFLCEVPILLKLACPDANTTETVLFTLAGIFVVITFLVICVSYAYIMKIILKIPSMEGRKKAFSTCSAHLMVVFLFYGTASGRYLKPSSSSLGQDKLASLFYTVVSPMLNPIIYSLRNGEVKNAAKKACSTKIY